MAVETGNLTQLAIIQELQFGTTPPTPTGQLLRFTDLQLAADASFIDNPELRVDMMRPAGRRGALRGKGSIGGKLSYGTYDDLLAAFCGLFEWSSNVIKIKAPSVMSAAGTGVTVAASGKTFTRGVGSFITDGFAVGDYVQWDGFTNAGNNITVKITTLTATVMTCSGASGLANESNSTTARCATNIRPSFTMERGHKVNGIYFPFTGCVVDGFSLSGKPSDAVEVSFDILSKAVGNVGSSSLFSAFAAANTNNLLTSWEGSVKRNGTAIANIVGWSIKAARSSDLAEVVGSSALYDIQPKSAQISGSLELYFDSMQSYQDFQNETDIAIQINLGTGSSKSYQIDLTKCRYKNWKPSLKDGMITASLDFDSVAPDSGTNTSLMLTRIP